MEARCGSRPQLVVRIRPLSSGPNSGSVCFETCTTDRSLVLQQRLGNNVQLNTQVLVTQTSKGPEQCSAVRCWGPFDAVICGHLSNTVNCELGCLGLDRPQCTQSLLETNTTLIAYGQTGTGKTHTMFGTEAEPGLAPTMIEHLFKAASACSSRSHTFTFSALEVYNDLLTDLLTCDEEERGHPPLVVGPDGHAVVPGLLEVPVESADQVLSLVQAVQAVRHGRDTQQAGRCGRSHALIRLTVRSGSNSASPAALPGTSPGPSTLACLTFADLAGSEGLAEGRHIDQSLLALGKVIRGLAANNSGPQLGWSESTLTRLLQSSMEPGSSRVVLLATISPLAEHAVETESTLSFAASAMQARTQAKAPHQKEEGEESAAAQVRRLTEEKQRLLQMQVIHLQDALHRQFQSSSGGGSSAVEAATPSPAPHAGLSSYPLLGGLCTPEGSPATSPALPALPHGAPHGNPHQLPISRFAAAAAMTGGTSSTEQDKPWASATAFGSPLAGGTAPSGALKPVATHILAPAYTGVSVETPAIRDQAPTTTISPQGSAEAAVAVNQSIASVSWPMVKQAAPRPPINPHPGAPPPPHRIQQKQGQPRPPVAVSPAALAPAPAPATPSAGLSMRKLASAAISLLPSALQPHSHGERHLKPVNTKRSGRGTSPSPSQQDEPCTSPHTSTPGATSPSGRGPGALRRQVQVLESKIKRLEGEAQEARDQGALATSGAKEAAAQQAALRSEVTRLQKQLDQAHRRVQSLEAGLDRRQQQGEGGRPRTSSGGGSSTVAGSWASSASLSFTPSSPSVPDLDHYQQQVAQAEARASAAEQAAASLASQLEALQGRVQVAEARLAGSQRQVELLAQALAEAREKACDEDMLAELQEALAASEAQLEAAEREVGAGQREIWERERTIKNLAARLEQAEAERTCLGARVSEYRSLLRLSDTYGRYVTQEAELQRLGARLAVQEQQYTRLRSAVQTELGFDWLDSHGFQGSLTPEVSVELIAAPVAPQQQQQQQQEPSPATSTASEPAPSPAASQAPADQSLAPYPGPHPAAAVPAPILSRAVARMREAMLSVVAATRASNGVSISIPCDPPSSAESSPRCAPSYSSASSPESRSPPVTISSPAATPPQTRPPSFNSEEAYSDVVAAGSDQALGAPAPPPPLEAKAPVHHQGGTKPTSVMSPSAAPPGGMRSAAARAAAAAALQQHRGSPVPRADKHH